MLRKIIRRAHLQGYKLGINVPFMHLLVDSLIEIMGYYSDLSGKSEFIKSVLMDEETQFIRLLSTATKIIQKELTKLKSTIIPDSLIYKFYDTYGIPDEVVRALVDPTLYKFEK